MNRLAIGALAGGFLLVAIGVSLLSGLAGLFSAASNLTGMALVLGGGAVVIYGIDQLVKDDDGKKEESEESEDSR